MEKLVLSRQQVRQVDRTAIEDYGMSGLVLMENAGRGCADVLCAADGRGPVVVACGKGNNGGDGFVIARHLDNRGVPVRVVLVGEPDELSGDAAANFAILQHTGIPLVPLPKCDPADRARWEGILRGAQWIVDALLGTGAKGAPRPPYDEVIRLLNQQEAKKLAVDIPSGLDCDTGEAFDPTFRADHTCSFVALKPGLLADNAQQYTWKTQVIDIGVPRQLVAEIAKPS